MHSELLPVSGATLPSSAHIRIGACSEFERSHQLPCVSSQPALVHEHIEHGHVTTFDILSRAASTLTHPTTWASNMLSLVSSATSASEPPAPSSWAPEGLPLSAPAQAASTIDVTCITPPLLTLTESGGLADVTMTRRLSLSELSRPPYAPWPPRESRTVLCANAAANVSRCLERGEEDPLRFMLPWVMDKRFMFPLPLDHQGRASFRSGRWWSRRNLGYEHIRPTPVHYVMRKKSTALLPADAVLSTEQAENTGDETLPLTYGRQETSSTVLQGSSMMNIREAALAMARAGHERVLTERRQSLPSQDGQPALTPVLLHAAPSNSDNAFAHFTDSDSDAEMDQDRVIKPESPTPQHLHIRHPSTRRAYASKRVPSIRGRSSSLRRVAISADESREQPAETSSTGSDRRLFAQRWHLGGCSDSESPDREPSLDSLSQDSEDSDDSLGMKTHPHDRFEHSSDTSEDSDSDDLDTQMAHVLGKGEYGAKGRCQLLGTVLEDDADDDLLDDGGSSSGDEETARRKHSNPASLHNSNAFRQASFFLADSPDEEAEDGFELVPPLALLQRTQVIEDLQAQRKMSSMHDIVSHKVRSASAPASAPARAPTPLREIQNDVVRSPTPASFAAAVLARPVPKVHMPGLGLGSALRKSAAGLALRPSVRSAKARTVYLDASDIMDWEPQTV
ncbi:hypothetical protein OC834_001382 [Tilletia horrida]|nr:hypothetical protein OC834_001382 [Tilletia horrida]KAK0558782.1 hypothetical protein OC844_004882 [Tilletia horrida]